MCFVYLRFDVIMKTTISIANSLDTSFQCVYKRKAAQPLWRSVYCMSEIIETEEYVIFFYFMNMRNCERESQRRRLAL